MICLRPHTVREHLNYINLIPPVRVQVYFIDSGIAGDAAEGRRETQRYQRLAQGSRLLQGRRLAMNNITAIGTHMKLDDIPSKNISSMRQLVRDLSHFGGHCTAACITNKCKCKKSLKTCNSSCHPGKM